MACWAPSMSMAWSFLLTASSYSEDEEDIVNKLETGNCKANNFVQLSVETSILHPKKIQSNPDLHCSNLAPPDSINQSLINQSRLVTCVFPRIFSCSEHSATFAVSPHILGKALNIWSPSGDWWTFFLHQIQKFLNIQIINTRIHIFFVYIIGDLFWNMCYYLIWKESREPILSWKISWSKNRALTAFNISSSSTSKDFKRKKSGYHAMLNYIAFYRVLCTAFCVRLYFSAEYIQPLRVHPETIGWGCTALFLKPLPYCRLKSAISPSLRITWPNIIFPSFRPASDLPYN